ncbi:MAG: preprotein translocase subunit SecE [Phycisphaera sp.]|nr:preprotein translocase subunit SecE [Phycisphaera sp.]
MNMNWKMYKPGQGYYTRMASFIAGAVLLLGLINWFWVKIGASDMAVTHDMTATVMVQAAEGQDTLQTLGIFEAQNVAGDRDKAPQLRLKIGTGSPMESAGVATGDVLTAVDGKPPEVALETQLHALAGKSVTLTYFRKQSTALYFQAGVAIVLIAVFGTLVFQLTAVKPRTCDFMIATEGEMKKVNWPTRKEIIGSTWIVICCVFLIALVLWLADLLFAAIFTQIGILDLK